MIQSYTCFWICFRCMVWCGNNRYAVCLCFCRRSASILVFTAGHQVTDLRSRYLSCDNTQTFLQGQYFYIFKYFLLRKSCGKMKNIFPKNNSGSGGKPLFKLIVALSSKWRSSEFWMSITASSVEWSFLKPNWLSVNKIIYIEKCDKPALYYFFK